MALFQSTVIQKYINAQDQSLLKEKWEAYKTRFLDSEFQENIRNAKEEQYQEGFLRDLFVNIFGYTLNPTVGFNLTTELKNVKDSKKADGGIIVNDKVVGVIELKGTNTTDLSKIEAQAFGYKNNQSSCTYVITSNFEKIRFYIDNAIEHEMFNLFELTEDQFSLLYLCLAYENIKRDIPKKIKNDSHNQEDITTKQLYKDYSIFKRELYNNLIELNPDYEPLLLFKKSQKLLDRFLFLFFAEDRHLLPPNSVRLILQQWKQLKELDAYTPLYKRFKKYFGYLNTGHKGKQYDVYPYNGGLFRPDEVLDKITIDDDLLYKYTLKLSEYDFDSEVDVNILGHIFENSLNEIEEIQTQLEENPSEVKISKRKKDGVFYTPKYITKYIVENTIGKLCEEKKTEVNLVEEDYNIKRQSKTKKDLLKKLNTYRDWLLQLTVVDPACGSGAFLSEALNYLIAEHQYLDELETKLMGGGLVFPNVENSILENNLFGVDINNESVEIAKLSLWLRTAQPNRKLNDLSNNIKCGNSLIDDPEVAGDKAFNWEKEFPQVFAKGGFDVVIGNPPYFNIQTLGVGSEVAQSIQRDYSEIWQDKSDILFYFFYKAMQISKSEIGYIVSNAFLFSDKAQRLRNYILKDDRLSKIINFDKYMVFSDASITSCITTFSKNKVETKAIILKDKQYTISEISDQINNPQLEFKIELEADKVFALVDSKIASLNKKIDSDHEKLQNIFHVGKGMETAANSVFSFNEYPNQFPEEYIKKRMVGEKIDRYFLSSIDSYLLYFEDVDDFEDLPNTVQDYLLENKPKLKNRADKKRRATSKWWNYSFPMHKEFYHLDKIWCSYRSKRNEFIIDQSQDFIGLTNTTVLFDTNKNYSLKYVLTLLNSKLLNFRYKSIGKQTGGGVYEYFANGIGKFPIPEISIKKQQPFIEKADQILALNQELDEISSKFQRNLQRQFPEELEKLPKKLQDWYELSYANFIKELKKKKIKFSLSQEAEWEEYFLSEQEKALQLSNQINTIDQEIDHMVYELYGLSEEEIEIVENS